MIVITAPIFKLGVRTNLDTDSNAMVRDEVYKVECKGKIKGFRTADGAGAEELRCDSSNPPTTIVDADSGGSGGAIYDRSAECLVNKDDYFKFTDTFGALTIHWQPFGEGGCVKQV